VIVANKSTIQVLVCVVAPPADVLFAIQKGRAELLSPFQATADAIWFGFVLQVSWPLDGGAANYRGDVAQGSPNDRFVYINSGKRAGQVNSCWERRAKLKLGGLPPAMVEAAADRRDRAVQAQLLGVAGDGGPVCASVRADAVTWAMVTNPASVEVKGPLPVIRMDRFGSRS